MLASQSLRRKELLSKAGFEFRVIVSDAEEITHGETYWEHIPFLNALAKSESVAEKYPGALVIGADTVIEHKGLVLGKPSDIHAAAEMLRRLSGKTHNVTTAICLRNLSSNVKCIFSETTAVTFLHLDESTINGYLKLVNPLDKAGAYAIQEYGEMLVAGVDGPLDNVIGLPVEKLRTGLYSCFCALGSSITKRAPGE